MPTTTSKRCEHTKYRNWEHHRCNKPAKYEANGKWYCGVHSPGAVARRRERVERRQTEQRNAEDKIKDEARQICEALGVPYKCHVDRNFAPQHAIVIDFKDAHRLIEQLKKTS